MIVLTNPIRLYGRTVVTDLALRTGEATSKDYSCTLGLSYVIQNLWSGDETLASIEMLFSDQTDFDADVTQPHMTEDDYDEVEEQEGYNKVAKYNPAVDKTDFDKYYRRLEDIAHPYLENYVSNLVYTICRYNSGAKSFEAAHREQPTLVSTDDSEDVTELADLQLYGDETDWSPDVKQTALTQLPYVLKRLHNLSCYCRVHMLSFIVAYLKAREKNVNARISGSVKSLKKNAVITEGVYLCNELGNIQKQVTVQSKNVRAAKMFDWIIGMDSDFKAYYQDYLNFVHYCNVLNIDLINDDLTKYDNDFMSGLLVTTVTPNKQYDQQVYEAILSNSAGTVETEDVVDNSIVNTFNTFQQICSTNKSIVDYTHHYDHATSKRNMETAMSLYNTYAVLYLQLFTESNKYSWEDGYLYYDGNLVVISTSLIGDETFKEERCLINELGYCIQVSNGMGVYVMALSNALDNMLNKVSTKDPDYRYAEWVLLTV